MKLQVRMNMHSLHRYTLTQISLQYRDRKINTLPNRLCGFLPLPLLLLKHTKQVLISLIQWEVHKVRLLMKLFHTKMFMESYEFKEFLESRVKVFGATHENYPIDTGQDKLGLTLNSLNLPLFMARLICNNSKNIVYRRHEVFIRRKQDLETVK